MTDSGMDRRLEFMQVGPETRRTLRAAQPLISEALPAALDHFYAQVRRTPETRAHFRDDAHINTAQNAQLRHWQTIAEAAIKSVVRSVSSQVGSQIGRALVRGVLGSLLK